MAEVKGAWRGHLAMLGANMIWGCMTPISKHALLEGHLTGVALSAIRIAGGALLFVVMGYLLPRSLAPREHVLPADRWKMVLAGLLMISFNQGLYITGLSFTSPLDASIMATMTPIATMILAAIFLAMPITWLKAGGVAIALAGALLLVFSQGGTRTAPNPLLGDTLCFIAQICASIYYVFFKDIITRYAPWTLMKWMFISAAIYYVPLTYPWWREVPFTELSTGVWLSIGYIIVFATFICYLLIPFAQRLLKPTVVSMYTYFQPVFSGLLSAVLGIALFGVEKIAATALIFTGVAFVTRSRGAATHKPAPR